MSNLDRVEQAASGDDLEARAAGWYGDMAANVVAQGCPFCDLREKYMITVDGEGESRWILTTNIFPRSRASLMTLPLRHIEHVSQLTEEDALRRQRLEQLGFSLLQDAYGVENVHFILREGSQSGKSVPHLHSHVMTYYHGVLKWWDEAHNPKRRFRTPAQANEPLIPAIEVAQTLREALARRGSNGYT